jgi:hypothetical protein
MESLQTSNESEILSRVIVPENGNLPEPVATALLGLAFPKVDVLRMNQLAEKNRRGVITESERDEMERYSRVGNLINLLQSKARRSLKHG